MNFPGTPSAHDNRRAGDDSNALTLPHEAPVCTENLNPNVMVVEPAEKRV